MARSTRADAIAYVQRICAGIVQRCKVAELPMDELGGLCQSLGVSARGSRDELVNRIITEMRKDK